MNQTDQSVTSDRFPRDNRRRRIEPGQPAFTLMELLTVLAIIGILFIIVAPRIQNARLRASATNCRNNIRQYGVALNQFLEANNGNFINPLIVPPPVFLADSSGGGRIVFDGGTMDPGDAQPNDPGMPAARQWIGQLVFPYIYNLTNSYSGTTWWNATRAQPQQIPFYNKFPPAVDAVIIPEQWPTYCPATLNSLVIFTTRRPRGLNTVPNAELWAVNNPKGFKGFGVDDTGQPDPDMGRFTTYAINNTQVGNHRGQIPGNVVAFADWNHIYGWWAWVNNNPGIWGMNNNRMGAVIGVGKPGGRLGCFTEVGFHHPGGDQMSANALLFNGNVVSILSNQASSNVYWQ